MAEAADLATGDKQQLQLRLETLAQRDKFRPGISSGKRSWPVPNDVLRTSVLRSVMSGKGRESRCGRYDPRDILEGAREDHARAIMMTTEDREWRDTEQTPAYQAWERERNQPIHELDAEELGWQAEQRFYAEQDPQSEWYREDTYHGEPGPDVAIDLAEEGMRRRARSGV